MNESLTVYLSTMFGWYFLNRLIAHVYYIAGVNRTLERSEEVYRLLLQCERENGA